MSIRANTPGPAHRREPDHKSGREPGREPGRRRGGPRSAETDPERIPDIEELPDGFGQRRKRD